MDSSILKTVGEIAGIGGLSLGVVLLVFRDVIRKKIFPTLTKEHAYRLLRLIVILTFAVGLAGLAAWVLTKRGAAISYNNVTNIGAVQNEYLTLVGQPLDDPELKKLIQHALGLTAKGYTAASIPVYQQAIEKAPLPSLYNNLGVAYAQQNAEQPARKAFQDALAKNPTYDRARDNLKALDLPHADPDPVHISSQESEPNDDLFHANIMPLNKGVLGAIDPASDVDTFQFETGGKSRDWIDITLENRSTSLVPSMRILQANKEELIGWNAAGTNGANHELHFVATPATRYFFQMGSHYNQSTGAYVLTVKPRLAFDSYEPDDDIAHAAPIQAGSPVKANIMDGGDADFYKFESGAAGDMTVTIENTSTTLAPAVRVLDESRSDITGWQANANPGGHLKFTFKAAAKGTYYAQVGGNYGQSAGTYTLTVR